MALSGILPQFSEKMFLEQLILRISSETEVTVKYESLRFQLKK